MRLTAACLLLFFVSCTASRKLAGDEVVSISGLRLLDEKDAPFNLPVKETTLGGLSGIDYDAANDCYYLICDDRSSINPARYYTAKIAINNNRIDSVYFTDVAFLHRADGSLYPNAVQDPAHTPDPEALRYNPLTKQMTWSSEGERIIRGKDTVLEDPSIIIISPDGKYVDSFPLPANLRMHASENGPRQNEVLEGMSFSDHYRYLWLNAEGPLYEDGPRADLTPNNAWIRLFKFDARSKKNIAQYAYMLEPVAYPATPPMAFKVNGIPDILSIGNNKMIVMERSFSTGRLPCTIRLFLADMNGAENIIDNPSLKSHPPKYPVTKKLLLNMDDLGIYIDNVEGMALGPTLPNGHKTLLLVSDNNFVRLERTQFFLFEIIP